MKRLFFCVSMLLLLFGPACAQQKNKLTDAQIDRLLARILGQKEDTTSLKSYYRDHQTADLCEAWNSCAKWAFEQYVEDQTFIVTRAVLRTERIIHRHRVTREQRLYIQATAKDKTINVLFVSPRSSGRIRSYRYIPKFPFGQSK